ncbi:MAG: hypothetical protein ABI639_10265 [Thermoanaerobaculia bacterium]
MGTVSRNWMGSLCGTALLLSLGTGFGGAAPAIAQTSCLHSNRLLDGGFEATNSGNLDNPEWIESSLNFGTPLCNVGGCIGFDVAPRQGNFWVFFGGVTGNAPETASVRQTRFFPLSSTVTLHFNLRVSAVEAPYTDVLKVLLDGLEVGSVTEPATAEAAYVLRTSPLGAGDGALHEIKLEYVKGANGGAAAFNVDDIALDIIQFVPDLDGSFEAATGDPLVSPRWSATSTHFITPLCTVALCGNGGGVAVPHSGSVWAWFGGYAGKDGEDSSLSQTVVIPRGTQATLITSNWISAVSSPATDVLTCSMDGNVLWTTSESQGPAPAYGPIEWPIASYANGEPHVLSFVFSSPPGGGTAHFNLDDVEIGDTCRAVLLDNFETRDASNWSSIHP